MTSAKTVNVLGIGGSLREGSQSERALQIALAAAAEVGVRTRLLSGPDLVLPFYDAGEPAPRDERAMQLVDAVRHADGLIVVSPGYHGALSGLVKNALDYVEDLRDDARPYLDGRAVGLAAVAYGWQAAVTTLEQLRTITHALRGWATPLGGSINSAETKFDDGGGASDEKSTRTLRLIGRQVAEFAVSRHS